jgi:ABC-type transport system involved in multi-copper enzyme maturation permease subunit
MTPGMGTTFAILRKDAPANLVSLVVLWPLIAVAEILMAGRLDPGLVFINSGLIVILIVGSILVNEIEEETNGGYRIFDGLPARRAEIVNAKFLSALLLTLGFTLTHYVLTTAWSVNPEQSSHVLTIIVSSGVIALTAAGLLYVGVFLFGLSRALSFLGITFWIVSAIVIILAIVFNVNVNQAMRGVMQTLGRTDRMITVSIGLSVFIMAWLIAIRFVSVDFSQMFRNISSRLPLNREAE